MPQVSVSFDKRQMRAIQKKLADVRNGVPAALSGAINDTAKWEKTQISTNIRKKFNIKKQDLDPHLSVTKATQSKLTGGIHLEKSKRLGLQYFGAKQVDSTKRASVKRIAKGGGRSSLFKTRGGGVTAQIEKGKRLLYIGAFMGPKPGAIALKLHGGVFKRIGNPRLPIKKLFGLSAWGAFVKGGMLKPAVEETQKKLKENVDRRVNFLLLKDSGQL